ncbi:MAG: RNA polymerase sigma factor [Vicinamibacterales bacterium]
MAVPSSEWLERLRARDPGLLKEVVDREARRVYRAARSMGFSPADADDLTQDVFVTFLETVERFEGRSQVATWLFGILHHKAQQRRRVTAREESTDAIEELFDGRFDRDGSWIQAPAAADRLVASRETALALRECLAELPALQQTVFHLRQVEELTAAEVSRAVGCTTTHVRVILHRARSRLKACLDGKGQGRP